MGSSYSGQYYTLLWRLQRLTWSSPNSLSDSLFCFCSTGPHTCLLLSSILWPAVQQASIQELALLSTLLMVRVVARKKRKKKQPSTTMNMKDVGIPGDILNTKGWNWTETLFIEAFSFSHIHLFIPFVHKVSQGALWFCLAGWCVQCLSGSKHCCMWWTASCMWSGLILLWPVFFLSAVSPDTALQVPWNGFKTITVFSFWMMLGWYSVSAGI